MARESSKREYKKRQPRLSIFRNLQRETARSIWAILLFTLAGLLALSAVGSAGIVGNRLYELLWSAFGFGYLFVPILLAAGGLFSLRSLPSFVTPLRMFGALLLFTGGLGIAEILKAGHGGLLGKYLTLPLISLFALPATLIFLAATVVIALIILIDAPLTIPLSRLLFWRKRNVETSVYEEEVPVEGEDEISYEEIEIEGEALAEPEGTPAPLAKNPNPFIPSVPRGSYEPPPLSLLEKDRGKPGVGDIKANANLIKRTLQNFGIQVEMDEISIGPSVTRYTLKPAEGVRLSKISGLQTNLELALAAHPVRIEAPIPGKSLVGIEVPNTAKTTVGLGTLLGSENFQGSLKPLIIALGRDIAGVSHFADLAKMPHLLIAGATGSGKSVTIHTIITSLFYRNSPEDLRFIMIDPKRVELTLYNHTPHLLTPVITDAKKAILALKWLGKEMDRRYDILEAEHVRDIDSYHKNIVMPALAQRSDTIELPEPMPYMVVVIDELADIMQTYPKELEAAVVRLAQMSRAVGIHLILSTQRPSVNVITGLIKANIPARIALQVASQIDSRTILDGSGAEKLLGAGDMLYLSAEMSKPMRIQAAYISEQEVKRVTKFLSDHNRGLEETPIDFSLGGRSNAVFSSSLEDASLEDDDALYDEARTVVTEAGKASTSYLQRRLRVGYARAARLMDLLEERGVIGPSDGAKPRMVISRSEENGVYGNSQ